MTDCLTLLPAVLHVIAPQADATIWTPPLAASMRSCGISTKLRAAAFVGQCAAESGFTQLSENMTYSAARMCQVWPVEFPSLIEAARYSQRPEALANFIYANKQGNGDEASGDGWRFRGGGLLQLTFRDGYAVFGHAVGMSAEDAADYVRTPEGAARSACWFWTQKGLNALADAWDLRALTARINASFADLNRRVALCTTALNNFGGITPAPLAPTETADQLMAEEQGGRVFPTEQG